MKKGSYFTMAKLDGPKAQIDIYGDIVSENYRWYEDETSAVSFRDALAGLGDIDELEIHINSGGGDVFEAVAIFNMIKRHKAKVSIHIDGLAASAASVIAMAADTLYMPENSMLMIHNAWSVFMGNHHELRDYADQLEKINDTTVKQSYLDKNPDIDVEALSQLMDKETWLSASEAFEMGLVDEVLSAVPVAASITKDQMARYENAPTTLKNSVEEDPKDFGEILKQVEENFNKRIEEFEEKLKASKEEPPADPVKDSSLSAFFLNIN